jgi:hypothetical protein
MRPLGGNVLVLKAAPSGYVVFGIIFGFLTFMTGLAASTDKSMRLPFFICLSCWILSYAWLCRLRFVMSTDSISYRTLFRGTSTYGLTEIRRITKESGIREYSDRFKPFVRLVIRPSAEVSRSPLYVNLKVFRTSGVRRLLTDLVDRFNAMGRPEVVKDL